MSAERLIVASNRLPLVLSRAANGEWRSEPGSGGLVTALLPVLRRRGGVWVGWSGGCGEDASELESHLAQSTALRGVEFEPVSLTEEEILGFYEGFSNEIVWPLFHDLLTLCRFEPAHWRSYLQANRKYAQTIAASARDGDLVWIHDYHLIGVAKHLRAARRPNPLGFFLHIPFPAPDMFMRLPWRFDILTDLVNHDLIGFQTQRDVEHFLECLHTSYSVKSSGPAQLLAVEVSDDSGRTRRLRVGTFPVSIDHDDFATIAASPDTHARVAQLRRATGGRRIVLSVDRLDYTKGILAKLEGFRAALRRYPELIDQAVLHLQVVPSREHIPGYQQLHLEIERAVGEINGEFSKPGSIPVHYYYQSVPRNELIARYRAADVMLVTPFKDGMNLVAKEYCSCQIEAEGVLVLSEFAGAAADLEHGALLVNPHDVGGMAAQIQRAIHMKTAERVERMSKLRREIESHDVFRWARRYTDTLSEQPLPRVSKVAVPVANPARLAVTVAGDDSNRRAS